jgi:predicted KAP-like P-loop ATPase
VGLREEHGAQFCARGADHGGQVAIFPFNPWLFKDQDALLREFFAGLARTIGSELGKTGKDIGELMERYGGALSSVPLMGDSLTKIVEALGKDLAKDPTSAQRKRLTDLMRKARKKVVVLIDDLDRLDRDEIMIMLKMVRLSANFPNVIYLLAFDEERVARVAGQAYGEPADGRLFLEKIIQYPFSLPAVGSDRLTAYVIRHARGASDGAGITLSDKAWAEFHRICKEVFLLQLNTPRQAIRYANALRFALPILKGEVDPFDQMIVEAMRILFPTLYSHVRDHLDFGAMKFPEMSPAEREVAEALIKVLMRWERESAKPVSDPRYHARYFSYAVATDDVSDVEMESLIDLSNKEDQATLNAMIRTRCRKTPQKACRTALVACRRTFVGECAALDPR